MPKPQYSWQPIQPDRFKQKAFDITEEYLGHAPLKPLASYINDIIDSGWIVSDIVNHGDRYTILAYKITIPKAHDKETSTNSE